jgi:hypothetical protein
MDIQSIREFIAHGEIIRDKVSIPVTIVESIRVMEWGVYNAKL